nr:hypothetical protein [Tanacetum cinerariifolium]
MRQHRWIELFNDYDCEIRYHLAQEEASDEFVELQRGLDEMIECRSDRALYYLDQIWVPLKGDVLVAGNEEDIPIYASRYLTYLKVKAERLRSLNGNEKG